MTFQAITTLALAALLSGCVASGGNTTRATSFGACMQRAEASANRERAVSECHWAIPRGAGR